MRAVRGGERTSPKTVLGFLAIMVSILASATVFSVLFLSEKSKLYYLIPIVLMVFIVVFVLITGAVLLIGWKDPSKLMLGQITGRDYALIQRLTLGDSNAGERVDNVIVEVGEISQLGHRPPVVVDRVLGLTWGFAARRPKSKCRQSITRAIGVRPIFCPSPPDRAAGGLPGRAGMPVSWGNCHLHGVEK